MQTNWPDLLSGILSVKRCILIEAGSNQFRFDLLVFLRTEAVVAENDRVDLLNTVAAGLSPASSPQIRVLWRVSVVKPSYYLMLELFNEQPADGH